MAGNTKLNGFNLADGSVQLERWGGKADFKISEESVAEIEKACRHELPKQPKTPKDPVSVAGFDQQTGHIILAMDPGEAEKLADLLLSVRNAPGHAKDNEEKLIDSWSSAIKLSLMERAAWFEKNGEPGVD